MKIRKLAGARLLAGAGLSLLTQEILYRTVRSGRLQRSNFRGRTVHLGGGLGAALGACAVAATTTTGPTRVAALLATTVSSGVGLADDLDPTSGEAKGLKGHFKALTRGQVTTGAVKLLAISTTAVAAAAISGLGRRGPGAALDALTSGALIAGTANLVNLFDLRPGRALKVTAAAAGPLMLSRTHPDGAAIAKGVLAVVTAVAPRDLGETTMLGDVGANSLGALLGIALATHPRKGVRIISLAVVSALTIASEKVSFSQVIDDTQVLRAIDRWGRAE